MDTEKTIPQNIYKIFISAIAVLVSMWIMDNFIVDKDWYKYITSIPFFAQFFKIISLDKIFTTTIVIILYSYLYFQEILPCKRRKYQPVTKYEGDWIEISNHKERTYSICSIYYNINKHRHSYAGHSFNKERKLLGDWKSHHISKNGTELTFLGRGHKWINDESITINTAGRMEFYADDNHGIGFYVDYPDNNNAAHLEQIRFDMYKITKDLKKT